MSPPLTLSLPRDLNLFLALGTQRRFVQGSPELERPPLWGHWLCPDDEQLGMEGGALSRALVQGPLQGRDTGAGPRVGLTEPPPAWLPRPWPRKLLSQSRAWATLLPQSQEASWGLQGLSQQVA